MTTKTNRLAVQAVEECAASIRKAAAAMPAGSGGAALMEWLVLDTLAAQLLANGRRNRWAKIPMTGVLGGGVEVLVNHGDIPEPVVLHALRVLYLLGEEDRCKEMHDALREILKPYQGAST